MFAQETIKVDEVAAELQAVRGAIGSGIDVAAFTQSAFSAYGAVVSSQSAGELQVDLSEAPRALRDAVGNLTRIKARFELPVQEGQRYLSRTHPVVEGLASYVMDAALDPIGESIARRCGVIRTSQVPRRTTVLLVRLRFHIVRQHGTEERQLLAEDCQVLAFAGSPRNAQWLDEKEAIERLLQAQAEANVTADEAQHFLHTILDEFAVLQPHLIQVAHKRGQELLDAHRRVRSASQTRGVRYRVEPQLPLDVLGVYVYVPRM
jgi:hypothetical protein